MSHAGESNKAIGGLEDVAEEAEPELPSSVAATDVSSCSTPLLCSVTLLNVVCGDSLNSACLTLPGDHSNFARDDVTLNRRCLSLSPRSLMLSSCN